jgi:uncharacterized protein YjbJ (UPF0337 family)
MEIDRNRIKTLDEGETAPIDEVEERVEAEMKRIEGSAKESVAQALQNEELEQEGRRQKEEADRELRQQKKND